MLDGRDSEVEQLHAVLARARSAAGASLLLVGEPGIGKSALLTAAAGAADGFRVLRTRGLEAETTLPFAGLAALAEPLLGFRAGLPAGQAAALAAALALEAPTPYDRFAVPTAFLALLRAAAADRPVLAVTDDLHWLDAASRDALLFVARRLDGAGVALLLATRPDAVVEVAGSGVERLTLGPVSTDAARRIVRSRGAGLGRQAIESVVVAAGGNPLALIELPTDARTPELPLAAGPLVERAFARRLDELPDGAGRAAGVAAAMEGGTLSWLLGALERRGLGADALDELERRRILEVRDDQVAFRHPLLRAAAYHRVTEPERRAAHAALAATAPDAARAAWQLAAAAEEHDATAAAALEQAARQARAVGGRVEAATAFARAAALSAVPDARGRRELEAAGDWAIAGRLDAALELLQAARRHAGPADQPEVTRQLGTLQMRRGRTVEAVDLLLGEADRRQAAGDTTGAVDVLVEAALGPILTGDLELAQRLLDRAEPAARRVGGARATLVAILAGAQAAVTGRNADADAALERAEAGLPGVDVLQHSELVGMAAQASLWLGAEPRAERILGLLVETCERAGAISRLPYLLAVRAQLRIRQGAWPAAAADAEEAGRLARDTEQALFEAFALASRSRVLAWHGELAAAEHATTTGLSLIDGRGADGVDQHLFAARGFHLLAAGRPAQAVAAFERAQAIEERHGFGQPALTAAAGDHVEALAAAGRHAEAHERQAALAATAAASGSAWAGAVAARGALLLAPEDLEAVTALTAAALHRHDVDGLPHERARTELLAGQRLRRLHARAAARPVLLDAMATFARLGAPRWAELARRELQLAGYPVVASGTVSMLDAADAEIARLVAEGRTNRDIAARLLLSEKTLERRLTALYRRLGVTGRTELAALVGAQG